jgi:hypothetical protein
VGRYEWSRLNHLQVGKYAEYFVKMEFTMYGWQVYSTEVDDRGIDFVVRSGAGRFVQVQVKSARNCDYVFFPKDKFPIDPTVIAAVVLFDEGKPPSLFLIPSTAWNTPDALLCRRDYEGKKSKPEWGLTLTAKGRTRLADFNFDSAISALTPTGRAGEASGRPAAGPPRVSPD